MKLIIDTDFGCDIDDTFSLAYLLKRAPKDIALILTAHGSTRRRAELLADYLGRCGYTDIPIGIGVEREYRDPYLYKLADFNPSLTLPPVIEDGVGEAIRIIMESEEPVVIVALAPLPNLAEIVRRCPQAAEKVRVVAMIGSVRMGYFNSPTIDAENNVVQDIVSCKEVFAGYPHLKITPLDTCGDIYLKGQAYEKMLACKDPLIAELMKDFEKWMTLGFVEAENSTSCLYDVVAAYMAFEDSWLKYERIPLVVDEEGYTRISEEGTPIDCAMEWVDKKAFEEHLLNIFVGE